MQSQPSILIFDENTETLSSIKALISDAFDVHIANDIKQAECVLQQQWIQVFISKQKLAIIDEKFSDIIWLVLSDENSQKDALKAINNSEAQHFICPPWNTNDISVKLTSALHVFNLQRDIERLTVELKLKPDTIDKAMVEKRQALKARFDWDSGIIRSPDSVMNGVCNLIHNVGPFDVNVLFSGESGTGKALCAQAIHYNSLRQSNTFTTVSCAALSDELLESELFGHKQGSFAGATENKVGLFEQADGGTIFLDEIDETSPAVQAKLLRVIQEGVVRPIGERSPRQINVRVIAATNQDLKNNVINGKFRQDLFYRLSTFEIHTPPLRERKEDIVPLAINILNNVMEQLGKHVKGITNEALESLTEYHWPGNIRELQNEVTRMLVLCQEDYLSANLLSPQILQATPEESVADINMLTGIEGSLKERVESLESIVIKETLMRLRWNKTKVAEELGLSRVGLRNKMERYGLEQNSSVKTLTGVA